jgi:hypothetical protein
VNDFFLLDLLLDAISFGLRSVIWIVGAAALMLLGTVLIGIFVLALVAIVAILF